MLRLWVPACRSSELCGRHGSASFLSPLLIGYVDAAAKQSLLECIMLWDSCEFSIKEQSDPQEDSEAVAPT